jgi:hypothetical protein
LTNWLGDWSYGPIDDDDGASAVGDGVLQVKRTPAKRILDETLQTDDWLKKLVGMQIVLEGLAL